MQRSKEFDNVVDVLKKIIQEQGEEILNKPNIVKSYMWDYKGVYSQNYHEKSYKKYVDEVGDALEIQAAESLLNSSSENIPQTKKKLVLQLQDKYYVNEGFAIEAVDLICSALDIPEIDIEKTNQTDAISQPGTGEKHNYSNNARQVYTGGTEPASQKVNKSSYHDSATKAKRYALANKLSREWDAVSTINSDRDFLKAEGSAIRIFFHYRRPSILNDIGFLLLIVIMIVLLIRVIIMVFAGSIWGCLWRIAIIIICGREAFSLYCRSFKWDRDVFLQIRRKWAQRLDEIDRLNHDFPEGSRLMPAEYQDERHYKTAIDLLHHGAVDTMSDIVTRFKSI